MYQQPKVQQYYDLVPVNDIDSYMCLYFVLEY